MKSGFAILALFLPTVAHAAPVPPPMNTLAAPPQSTLKAPVLKVPTRTADCVCDVCTCKACDCKATPKAAPVAAKSLDCVKAETVRRGVFGRRSSTVLVPCECGPVQSTQYTSPVQVQSTPTTSGSCYWINGQKFCPNR